MAPVLAFPGGVRVLSRETGETLYELGDEPLKAYRGRLVPVRDRAIVYAVLKARWVRRQLARRPAPTAAQQAMGRRLKRELTTRRTA